MVAAAARQAFPITVMAMAMAMTFQSPAQAQTSVYSNVVGFNRLDVPANGLALVATPFDAGTNASVQQVVGPQLTGGGTYSTGDRILIWNQQSASFIRLYQRADVNPAIDGKWVDTSVAPNILATNQIPTGLGFWIENIHTSNQTVYVVGDIVTDAAVTNAVSPGLQLLSYPYSADVLLNSSGLTNGHPGISYGDADRVILWDPDAQLFKRYYLREHTNPTIHRKWIDTSVIPNILATNALHTGEGFWYERITSNDFQWVENRPYPVP